MKSLFTAKNHFTRQRNWVQRTKLFKKFLTLESVNLKLFLCDTASLQEKLTNAFSFVTLKQNNFRIRDVQSQYHQQAKGLRLEPDAPETTNLYTSSTLAESHFGPTAVKASHLIKKISTLHAVGSAPGLSGKLYFFC